MYVYFRADNWVYPLFYLWRYETISKENQINEEIRDKEVRVIDSDGTQVGIVSQMCIRDRKSIVDTKVYQTLKEG